VSNPVADIKSLEEELDEECARELSAAFLEDSATSVSGIDAAIAAQDFNDLKAHAHGLKGCCRTIKAPLAEQLCTDLETAAVNHDWNQVASLRPQLAAAYEELCAFIHSYLGTS
jgi:HPt (histidine-containing phosphotransfer) domain-containing protein